MHLAWFLDNFTKLSANRPSNGDMIWHNPNRMNVLCAVTIIKLLQTCCFLKMSKQYIS